MGYKATVSGSVDQMVSVTTIQHGPCSEKTATDDMQTNGQSCAPTKLHLQKWDLVCRPNLSSPGLEDPFLETSDAQVLSYCKASTHTHPSDSGSQTNLYVWHNLDLYLSGHLYTIMTDKIQIHLKSLLLSKKHLSLHIILKK